MYQHPQKLHRALRFAIICIILIGVLIAFSNLKRLGGHFLSMNLLIFSIAGLCVIAAYLLEGIFLFFALRLFDEKLPFLSSLKYSFVINAMGYIVSFGGMTPFATQIYILSYHNIAPKKATLTRALHVVTFNVFFNFLLAAGYTVVLLSYRKSEFNITLITATVFFFFVFLVLFYLAIFWERFREKSLKGIFNLFSVILKIFSKNRRLGPEAAGNFFNEFKEGVKNLLQKPGYIFVMVIVSIVDWVFLLAVMKFSFLSLNYSISNGFLIIGFTIGQIVMVVSLVPGGIGTLEGSMVLTYRALGVPLEIAVGAVLLFRFLYYIIPFLLSLPFYFSLKRGMSADIAP